MSTGERIDVHHHFAPPAYIEALGAEHQPHGPTLRWKAEGSLADMDRAGVATAMLSITQPGLWFGDDAAACRLARTCNEYAAQLCAAHPKRFGMFAALPLPDVEGSLREIAYALDELGAAGIGMFTSYGTKWLGDPAFAPVFEELNRRKAVVYTHPTVADCCADLIPGIPSATIEYGTDTTRAIASLVFGGITTRCPDVAFIFSHAGGTMPFLIGRFMNLAEERYAQTLPHGLLPELRRFYYDTAQAANRGAMASLRELVPVSQIVFGTDYPYRSAESHVRGLAACGFTAEELRAIDCENARRLLPHPTPSPA